MNEEKKLFIFLKMFFGMKKRESDRATISSLDLLHKNLFIDVCDFQMIEQDQN